MLMHDSCSGMTALISSSSADMPSEEELPDSVIPPEASVVFGAAVQRLMQVRWPVDEAVSALQVTVWSSLTFSSQATSNMYN